MYSTVATAGDPHSKKDAKLSVSQLVLGMQGFLFRVRPLTMCRVELPATIARVISQYL